MLQQDSEADREAREVLDGLDAVWASLREISIRGPGSGLDRPSRLPGWSVRDTYSHLIATLLVLAGRPEAGDWDGPNPPYIRNPLGRSNEVPVALRRGRPISEVVGEFRDVSVEASTSVATLLQVGGATQTVAGPHGPVELGQLLSIVLMDNWVHELDVRQALGIPGHTSGPAVAYSRDRMLGRIAGILKGDAELRGLSIAFHVLDPAARRVVLDDGDVEDSAAPAAVEVALAVEVLAALAGGRVHGLDEAAAVGAIDVDGDIALARRVVAAMPFTS